MASQPLRGYRRLPGPARRYRTPSGRVISRYEYDKRRAQRAGFRSWREVERFRDDPTFISWRDKARSRDPQRDVSYASQFSRDVRTLGAQRERGVDDDVVNDPDGALARLLVATGRRDPDWQFAVGDTPKGNRSR